jgi:tRNA/rRNA methyltransferase
VKDRGARRAWLEARDYRVFDIAAADVERDLAAELDRLAALLPGSS